MIAGFGVTELLCLGWCRVRGTGLRAQSIGFKVSDSGFPGIPHRSAPVMCAIRKPTLISIPRNTRFPTHQSSGIQTLNPQS